MESDNCLSGETSPQSVMRKRRGGCSEGYTSRGVLDHELLNSMLYLAFVENGCNIRALALYLSNYLVLFLILFQNFFMLSKYVLRLSCNTTMNFMNNAITNGVI